MLEVSGRDVLEALPLSSRHILGSAHTASFGSAPLCADRDRAEGRTFLARAAARPAAAERRALSFAVHLKCRRSVFCFFSSPAAIPLHTVRRWRSSCTCALTFTFLKTGSPQPPAAHLNRLTLLSWQRHSKKAQLWLPRPPLAARRSGSARGTRCCPSDWEPFSHRAMGPFFGAQ